MGGAYEKDNEAILADARGVGVRGGAAERIFGIFRRNRALRRAAGCRRTRARRGTAGLGGIERADAGARGRGRAALNADVPLRPRFAGGGDGIGSVFPLPLNCRFVNDVLRIREREKDLFRREPIERTHGKIVVLTLTNS